MNNIEEALKKARKQHATELVANHKELSNEINTDIALMDTGSSVADDELSNLRILHNNMLNSHILAEFRTLRTTLLQKTKGNNKTILVYSSKPRAGASYVSVNLAAALALDEKKTSLVINCDINNKAIYENLINSKSFGLVDYLSSEINAEQIIYPTGIKRLRVIPAGESEESFNEYFSLRRFHELLDEIKERYGDRYIILDGPSASDAADIRLLSEVVDIVLMVVPFGKDSVDSVKNASRLVSKDKFIGIVINDIPISFK